MPERYVQHVNQQLAQLQPHQQQQVTKDEDTFASWIANTVVSGITWDLAKKIARIMLTRGR